ncbi:MAG: sugar phosphate nucleotidyltransferase [Pseudomonadota bacterium]
MSKQLETMSSPYLDSDRPAVPATRGSDVEDRAALLSSEVRAEDVPVFILCGGLGTRLGGAAAGMPKPMVEIGGKPILAHIMSWYERFGFRRFILCTGYRADVISNYFLNYSGLNADFTVDLRGREIWYHQSEAMPDWEVTIARTGVNAMTGARLARAAARFLGDAEHFALTYGDGLTDADLGEEFRFHLSHGRIGTVLGVNPPSQFGEFVFDDGSLAGFMEKPLLVEKWINGGYFFFRRAFLDYLIDDDACILEKEPLGKLAANAQLEVHRYDGYWSCMDTTRDRDQLRGLWESGSAPWK